MEVGTDSIDWRLILPPLLEHCSELLIETLGGIKVFQRSKSFLESFHHSYLESLPLPIFHIY